MQRWAGEQVAVDDHDPGQGSTLENTAGKGWWNEYDNEEGLWWIGKDNEINMKMDEDE